MNHPPCNCASCQEGRRFMEIVAKLQAEDKEWMTEFYNLHLNIAEDLSYRECIMTGEWPSAVEQLTFALEQAKKKREEKKS